MQYRPPQPCRAFAAAQSRRPRARAGVTLIELLVVLVVLAVLMGLAMAAVTRARQASAQANCAANLRNIGNGFAVYANANGGYLPYVAKASPQWEDLLMEHGLRRETFLCPSDFEVGPTTPTWPGTGSSYNWRDKGAPTAANMDSLSGRLLQSARTDLILSYEALPGWHRAGMTVAVRTDMSVDTFDLQSFSTNLTWPVFK